MSSFEVRLKIEGWATVEVEADDESSALTEACDVVEISDVDEWEPIAVESEVNSVDYGDDEDEDDDDDDWDEEEEDEEDEEEC